MVRTPVRTSRRLDDLTGGRIFLKVENEQHSGAFKFRGALNAMLALPPARLRAGVVAASSGNHGLAVAMAARRLHATATVVIPRDCPGRKLSAIERTGACVIRYDPVWQDRDAIVARVAQREGRAIVPSSDHPAVIAGGGTVALELAEQIGTLDVLVVPVGGGGLAAGCAVALTQPAGHTRVVGVEPESGDDTRRSLAAGRRIRVPLPQTIADGLRHQVPGELTFVINSKLLDCVVLVSDEAIVAAMRFLFNDVGVLAEPSGACALAAVLAGRVPGVRGARAGVVVSGGNVAEAQALELMSGRVPGPA